jgi:hypothetical protein
MAKPASSSSPPIAPKKRGGIARAARRRAARRTEARRSNPGGGAAIETLKTVGVSVGAYGGTRLLQRMAWTIVSKRRPTWGRHIHAVAGAAAFALAWFAGRKVKAVERYHEAILVGTGVAAVQGVVSAYIPRYAWLMNDCRPEELRLPAAAQNPTAGDAGGEVSTDYLEEQLAAYERGQTQKKSRRPVQQAIETAAAADGDMGIDETLLEELGSGESIDDLYGGVFEDPTLAN